MEDNQLNPKPKLFHYAYVRGGPHSLDHEPQNLS